MLSPVRPSPPDSKDEVGGHQEELEEDVDLSQAMLDDPIVGVEVIHGQDGPGARQARPLPVPKPMSAAQKEVHDLTHLPMDEGCEICRLTRGLNWQHRHSHEHLRTIPRLVADYCYLRWSNSPVLRTVLVMRRCPYELYFAAGVPRK